MTKKKTENTEPQVESVEKENVTEEETKEYQKNYRKVNKERLNEYSKKLL